MNHPIAPRFSDIQQLRNYVYKTLCDIDLLVPGQFPMTERLLVRGGSPCGVLFSLYGPRAVILTAVWETEKNLVYFYNSFGERYLKRQIIPESNWILDEVLAAKEMEN